MKVVSVIIVILDLLQFYTGTTLRIFTQDSEGRSEWDNTADSRLQTEIS